MNTTPNAAVEFAPVDEVIADCKKEMTSMQFDLDAVFSPDEQAYADTVKDMGIMRTILTALEAYQAALPAPSDEPVAWAVFDAKGNLRIDGIGNDERAAWNNAWRSRPDGFSLASRYRDEKRVIGYTCKKITISASRLDPQRGQENLSSGHQPTQSEFSSPSASSSERESRKWAHVAAVEIAESFEFQLRRQLDMPTKLAFAANQNRIQEVLKYFVALNNATPPVNNESSTGEPVRFEYRKSIGDGQFNQWCDCSQPYYNAVIEGKYPGQQARALAVIPLQPE